MNYDSWVITLILAVDSVCAWLTWQNVQERRKQKIRRVVNAMLRSVGAIR